MKKRLLKDKRVLIILLEILAIILILATWYHKEEQLPSLEEPAQTDGTMETEQDSLSDTESEFTETESEFTETELTTETEQVLLNENPLTGEFNLTDEAVGKRPVAVMINNVNKSMPQYGIAQADIIFEIPVEGFLTRFMAIYADYTQMPVICSIRSCRPYFPAIAKGYDAVYVFSGMMSSVRTYLNSLDMTTFEGGKNTGGLFGRDQDRRNAGYALEHTLYFDGTGLPEVMEKKNLRTDIEPDNEGSVFTFNAVNEQVRPEGDTCTYVHIDFGAAEATLSYDLNTNTYKKDLNGNPQIDGVMGTQLEFTNVFVLETTIVTAENGIHKDVDWHGGKGYYVSNGAMQEITWSKADEESPIIFYDTNGKELSINRGKSYIAINRKNRAEFEAVITAEMIR